MKREIEIQLISREELSGIQLIWHRDFHDAPGVTRIYQEVFREELKQMIINSI